MRVGNYVPIPEFLVREFCDSICVSPDDRGLSCPSAYSGSPYAMGGQVAPFSVLQAVDECVRSDWIAAASRFAYGVLGIRRDLS